MSENHEIILETRGLTKRFHTSDGRPLTACDSISLAARRGETLGIVGESGCCSPCPSSSQTSASSCTTPWTL